jgi:hypothetical protein
MECVLQLAISQEQAGGGEEEEDEGLFKAKQ